MGDFFKCPKHINPQNVLSRAFRFSNHYNISDSRNWHYSQFLLPNQMNSFDISQFHPLCSNACSCVILIVDSHWFKIKRQREFSAQLWCPSIFNINIKTKMNRMKKNNNQIDIVCVKTIKIKLNYSAIDSVLPFCNRTHEVIIKT